MVRVRISSVAPPFCYNLYVYNFQKQNSEQTLREGLEEFYSINTQFRDLAEKDNPNAHIFKEHDYTHLLFGLCTSIE